MRSKPAVGVVGAGLIGGSIALAARAKGCPVAVFDPHVELEDEVPAGVAVMPDLASLAVCSQLIFLAVPHDALAAAGEALAQALRPGVVVSDVSSVKGEAARHLAEVFAGCADYVPSHPMAGSERSGWGAARASLFHKAPAIVCPDFAPERSVEAVEALWELLGARPLRMDVAQHDRIVAAVSHLPHALAAVLCEFVGQVSPEALAAVGPGFRDVTRIASGPPDLWVQILTANRTVLAGQLRRYAKRLLRLAQALEEPDEKYLQGLLDAAKRNRDSISE